MTAQELRQKYLDFFKSKRHTIIPSASLIPRETDASVLFTTAGMHPLVPYLLGEEHPGGKRVANVQKCVRTGDIDDVGDNRHLTFFEMMGNWSFGDYFKKEAIEWSFEFLTDSKWLGLDPERIYVTVFKGEDGIPRDEDAIKIWQETFSKSGMKADVASEDTVIKGNVRIIPLGTDDNFWIAGATGPCGGDTEMFYDTHPEQGKLEGKFHDLVDSGRIIEIWNDVFMEFEKKADGTVEKLKQQNVDTGMGVERTLAILNGKENVFETELFAPIFRKLEEISGKHYELFPKEFRIIADHIKAATFMIVDGVVPSNVQRGYVLRRLIRRAVYYAKTLGMESDFSKQTSEVVIEMYENFYKELRENKDKIFGELEKEENKFKETLERGISALKKIYNRAIGDVDPENLPKGISIQGNTMRINGEEVFNIFSTSGIPIKLIQEIMTNWGIGFDSETMKEAEEAFKKHQQLSRTASAGAFKGGLQSTGEMETKYHTATHLLLASLRQILGSETYQKGSNITAERLRFDFNYPQKLTSEQIKEIEDLVNAKIKEGIAVEMTEMPKDEALKIAKVSFDPSKYSDVVKVYKIGDFSIEVCGGPHVKNTAELGRFKITKEESSSAGLRRIKAILE